MDRILTLNSRVPEGKYKSTIIGVKLVKDKKEILDLIKKGYTFSPDVLEKAGFVRHVRNVTTSISVVEHEKDNKVYEKDTADVKSIIRSISTLDNGDAISEDYEDNNSINDEYEED